MNDIIEITTDEQKKEENAPTNPAFITYETLVDSMNKGLTMYGFYKDKRLIGCVGIEDAKKDDTFYIERLAVLPEYRHKGKGKRLMDYAFEKIRCNNGKIVSIGIISENEVLKDWYKNYGFEEVGIKKFDHLPFTVCFLQKKLE